MADGIYIALSGALAQANVLESTANNVANAGSAGFQGSRPVFRQVLADATRGAGPGMVQVVRNAVDTTRGVVRPTGRPLDVALPASTYMAVETSAGVRYTRAGSLRFNAQGVLETQTGNKVVGEGGASLAIQQDGGLPTILPDGSVVQGANTIGRLSLVTFNDPSSLQREGGTVLAATAASGAAQAADVTIDVGALEDSNGSVIAGMNELIIASRTFEAFEKSIEAFRDADRSAASKVMGT